MSAHTPGPWAVSPGFVGAGRVQIVSPSYRKECDAEHVICELRPWQRPDYGPDAQLIASAPELLAALREAYDALDYAQAQVERDDERMHLLRCRRKIKPVIDKAEGRDDQCAPTEA